MERLQRIFSGAGGMSHPHPDSPLLDTSEQVYISSLALLKMLKHGIQSLLIFSFKIRAFCLFVSKIKTFPFFFQNLTLCLVGLRYRSSNWLAVALCISVLNSPLPIHIN